MEDDAKPQAIALAGAALGLGIMLGPMVGIGVASLASSSMGGYVATGYFTVALSLLQLFIVWAKFTDDIVLGTSGGTGAEVDAETQKKNAALIASPYYPTARLVFWLSIAMNFLGCITFLAGFESTLTLQVQQAYSWSLGESMWAWGPMALFGMVFAVAVIPTIIDRMNWAKVCAFGLTFGWGSIFGINWLNLRNPIPAWWFVIEGVFANGNSVVGAVLSTILAQRLPTDEQVQNAALTAVASQVGRAMGPIFATWIFQTAEEMTGWSRGAGANFSRMYMLFVGSLPPTIVLACYFTSIFGKFTDLSPMERRELAKPSSSML